MHNVTDARDGKPAHSEHLAVPARLSPEVTLFTVAEKGDPARRRVELLFLEDRIVVNPWGDEACDIVREDLFALRELMAELPEEAFVRPADPVNPALKVLEDAPARSLAVDSDGAAYRKGRDGAWYEASGEHVRNLSTMVAYDAKIVWTP